MSPWPAQRALYAEKRTRLFRLEFIQENCCRWRLKSVYILKIFLSKSSIYFAGALELFVAPWNLIWQNCGDCNGYHFVFFPVKTSTGKMFVKKRALVWS